MKEFETKFEKFLTQPIEIEHAFGSLTQIGYEVLVLILLDARLRPNLGHDLKKKFTFGKIEHKSILKRIYLNFNIFFSKYLFATF